MKKAEVIIMPRCGELEVVIGETVRGAVPVLVGLVAVFVPAGLVVGERERERVGNLVMVGIGVVVGAEVVIGGLVGIMLMVGAGKTVGVAAGAVLWLNVHHGIGIYPDGRMGLGARGSEGVGSS
jgi:hypothetical protein